MEVFTQRLQDEFNVQIIMTSPSVPYRIEYPDGTVSVISNVGMWPEGGSMVKGTHLKGKEDDALILFLLLLLLVIRVFVCYYFLLVLYFFVFSLLSLFLSYRYSSYILMIFSHPPPLFLIPFLLHKLTSHSTSISTFSPPLFALLYLHLINFTYSLPLPLPLPLPYIFFYYISEPMVKVVLITPETYYGAMMDIVKERRGTDIITQFLDDGQVCLWG